VVGLETRVSNVEGKGVVSSRDLLRNSLRMRPDRIIVGEARGGEVLDMLQAMNTGHDGSMSTVHANDTRDALQRLELMIALSGAELPTRVARQYIASAIQIFLHLRTDRRHERRVRHRRHLCVPHGRDGWSGTHARIVLRHRLRAAVRAPHRRSRHRGQPPAVCGPRTEIGLRCHVDLLLSVLSILRKSHTPTDCMTRGRHVH
jgi:Type II/IV secretion system protein